MNLKAAAIPRKSIKDLENEVERIFQLQKQYKQSLKRTTAAERIAKLNRLRDKITSASDSIRKALALD